MAAQAVAVTHVVTFAAVRAAAGDIRPADRGGNRRWHQEPAPPGVVVRVSKHGLPPSGAVRKTRLQRGERPARLCIIAVLERLICGRLSGCHASPNTPTGLADGFGDGSRLPGFRPDTPRKVVPPFGVATDSAPEFYHTRRDHVLTRRKNGCRFSRALRRRAHQRTAPCESARSRHRTAGRPG